MCVQALDAEIDNGADAAYWPSDDSAALVDFTVGGLLAERARSHPESLALVGCRHGDGAEVRLTFAELYDEASRVATALSVLAAPGTYIALWAPNVVEWPLIQYGAALAGMVLVALNPTLRPQELEHALTHSGARVLIHADRGRDYDMGTVAGELARTPPGLRCVSLSERSSWQTTLPDPGGTGTVKSEPDDIVMLQYTSGTAGVPKAVLLKHRSLVNVAKLTLEAAGVEPGSVCLNPLPMFHTAGCVVATLGPLWIGGTAVLVEQFRPEPVLEALRREKVSVLFYVPAVLGALLESQSRSEAGAPRLRTIMGGASSVPAAMIEQAENVFGASVINLYGQTELSPVLSATRPGDSRDDRSTTVGRPLPRVECKIIDPTTHDTVRVGEPGEICARGFQQFVGYFNDPEAMAHAVDADGFVHTGDLGTMDARGYLTIIGRLKEIVIRGGENIAPADIESVLANHEMIVESSAVGLPDDRWGEIVAAVLRLKAEPDAQLKRDIIEFASARLAPFKVPARWFVIDELPVTPTGKVRKFEVRDAIHSGRLREL